jgi:predicted dehydrogenase
MTTVGFVGLGTIAETHLTVLAGIPEVKLGFVVDPDPLAPAAAAAGLAGDVPRYERLDAALGDHQPDLIVVATPTETHAALARQALTGSAARVLVEKPLVHDLAALDDLRALAPAIDLAGRVFVAHHFAFSPEVVWAADLIAAHPEWGPVTRIVAVFHDPYVVAADRSFAAYGSSWIDSGANQLSMLARFVEPTARGPLHEASGGASAWCTVAFRSAGDGRASGATGAAGASGATDASGATGAALLRTSWEAVASSKHTTISLERSGTELLLDHTAVTAVAVRDGALVDHLANDGRTPRKIAHYRPLYASLLSATPDPILGLATAERVLRLLVSDHS